MSSTDRREPVQLFCGNFEPRCKTDVKNEALKLKLDQPADNKQAEAKEQDRSARAEWAEKADVEKSVDGEAEGGGERSSSQGHFRESSSDSAKGAFSGSDLGKELLDGCMRDSSEQYQYTNEGFVDNVDPESGQQCVNYYTDLDAEGNEETFATDNVPRAKPDKLDLLEANELVVETESNFKHAFKDQIAKKRASLKKNLTDGKDKVIKRKESFKQNLEDRKETLKQNRESLKHNLSEGKEDIMRQLSLLVNKVEAGVNKRVRNIAAHIPSVTSPQAEKPPSERALEVSCDRQVSGPDSYDARHCRLEKFAFLHRILRANHHLSELHTIRCGTQIVSAASLQANRSEIWIVENRYNFLPPPLTSEKATGE